MADQTGQRGKIPLKSFLKDFHTPVDDAELRLKYNLSARTFVSLIKQLLARNVITPQDLAWRKEMAVKRDLKKESQFLSQLYICPFCGHPHPSPFTRCPACGADTEHSFAPPGIPQTLSDSGNNILVDQSEHPSSPPPLPEEKPVEPAPVEETPAEETEPQPESPGKASPLQSVRELFSKFRKK